MPEAIRNVVDLFVQEIRNVLGEDLKKVIVYGSYARGDYREGSDVDVMVLTSLTDEVIKPVEYKLYDVAFDFLMEYGVDISIIVKNEEHFKYWLGALPFYDNVVKEGVVIDGIIESRTYQVIDFRRRKTVLKLHR